MSKGGWIALGVVVVVLGGVWWWMNENRQKPVSTPAVRSRLPVDATSSTIDSDTPISTEAVGDVATPPPSGPGLELRFDPGGAA